MKTRLMVRLALAVAVTGVLPITSQADSAMDISTGRMLFMQKGCYECHGTLGQGSSQTGAALAPQPIPLDAMIAYVRHPKGQMPDYGETLLSNDEIAKIHAYLASIPANPTADSIPLLRSGTPSSQAPAGSATQASSQTTHGASVYAANCAACHGRGGEGAVGPSLLGISGKYQLGEIEARIRQPSGTMPRLYPKPLNDRDVQDVARYVSTMR
jgi:ubiquinol-cytochrome c reductase cytochrome c subunit